MQTGHVAIWDDRDDRCGCKHVQRVEVLGNPAEAGERPCPTTGLTVGDEQPPSCGIAPGPGVSKVIMKGARTDDVWAKVEFQHRV